MAGTFQAIYVAQDPEFDLSFEVKEDTALPNNVSLDFRNNKGDLLGGFTISTEVAEKLHSALSACMEDLPDAPIVAEDSLDRDWRLTVGSDDAGLGFIQITFEYGVGEGWQSLEKVHATNNLCRLLQRGISRAILDIKSRDQ